MNKSIEMPVLTADDLLRCFTVEQVCQRLNVAPRTVSRLISEGLLETQAGRDHGPGKSPRITALSLYRFIYGEQAA
ncbi:helix-turn-helix domain-containing protein [Corynebacterium sp. HMSC05E07]|uniref:helix-turn-helix domain-containing protein n=1 Tax=Corynebacterium sp. HMSC05E07 TaxID=1581117 RepID=UPI00114CFF57|nr:helix-turn-helix domain-containing protein [Corynebacterium sp. HMSC05E07]